MTQRERGKKARQRWQRLVFEQTRSGQCVAAFCRERGLARTHFFWWRKRLQAAPEVRHTPLTKFLEVKLTPAAPEPAGVGPGSRAEGRARPAANPPGASDGRVEVRLRNGRSLLVGPGFDAAHVRALVVTVESAA